MHFEFHCPHFRILKKICEDACYVLHIAALVYSFEVCLFLEATLIYWLIHMNIFNQSFMANVMDLTFLLSISHSAWAKLYPLLYLAYHKICNGHRGSIKLVFIIWGTTKTFLTENDWNRHYIIFKVTITHKVTFT